MGGDGGIAEMTNRLTSLDVLLLIVGVGYGALMLSDYG